MVGRDPACTYAAVCICPLTRKHRMSELRGGFATSIACGDLYCGMRSSTTRTFPTALLPAAPGVCVDHADLQNATLTVYLRATARTACCPQCQQPAHGIHSRYTRTAADLPWAGAAVRLGAPCP